MGHQVLLDTSNLVVPGFYDFRQYFVGLFVVTACIGDVAYRLDLVGQFSYN